MKIGIGLLGLGTVGGGVYKLLTDRAAAIAQQINSELTIKKILVRDIAKARKLEIPAELLTTDYSRIVNDPEIDIIVELLGGLEPAYQYITEALQNGKSVVTANKDVIAGYGVRLHRLAAEYEADLCYEASVAGGIPVLRGLVQGLASDEIYKVMGIVNGTTNYIMTQMAESGLDYEVALKQAQELGFAEPNPTNDVEGFDAARKMTILASLAFSMGLKLEDVKIKGISGVTLEDIRAVKEFGYVIKLIGVAKQDNGKAEISVEPTLLKETHPLASVKNEFNAIYLYGSAVGQTMFYGPGAGEMPTAMAVVSDIMESAKNRKMGVGGKGLWRPNLPAAMKTAEEMEAKYFLRLVVKDEIGVLNKITEVFARHQISIENILQELHEQSGQAGIIIITHRLVQSNFEKAMAALQHMKELIDLKSCYRVEE